MYKRPDFLDCPNRGEERRRIEISMRICFIWIPFGGFSVTQYITSIGLFYKNMGNLVVGVYGGYLFHRGSLFYLYSFHNIV